VLEDSGFDTTAVWTAQEFLSAIRSQAFELVLVNEYVPGGRCEELLQETRDTRLHCILMQARKPAGAKSYSLKEWVLLKLCTNAIIEGLFDWCAKLLVQTKRSPQREEREQLNRRHRQNRDTEP